MKGETEAGYEPDLILEMEKVITFEKNVRDMINRCYVIGDRTDLLKGKSFDYPKFENFLPVVKFLNIGGQHIGVDTTRNSEAVFDSSGDKSWEIQKRKKEIVLEEIDAFLIVNGLDGRSDEAKKHRIETITKAFQTSSKTAIENMKLEEIERGFTILKSLIKEKAWVK